MKIRLEISQTLNVFPLMFGMIVQKNLILLRITLRVMTLLMIQKSKIKSLPSAASVTSCSILLNTGALDGQQDSVSRVMAVLQVKVFLDKFLL